MHDKSQFTFIFHKKNDQSGGSDAQILKKKKKKKKSRINATRSVSTCIISLMPQDELLFSMDPNKKTDLDMFFFFTFILVKPLVPSVGYVLYGFNR